jgi:hypothetical protein
MARLSWSELMDVAPASHLVIGTVKDTPGANATRFIGRLLERLEPQGRYAIGGTMNEYGAAVQCAFESRQDADHFLNAVMALGLGGRPRRGNDSAFVFDRQAQSAIANEHKANEHQVNEH